MRLLFIKLKHIGDALLMTPTLAAVRAAYSAAQIWVIVRKGSEGILAGCSGIHRILTATAPEARNRPRVSWWSDLQLARVLRRQPFDYAFELGGGDRGRWLAVLSGAQRRVANRRHEFPFWWRPLFRDGTLLDLQPLHQVERDFLLVKEKLKLPPKIPSLQFERARADFSFVESLPLKDFIVLHPATRWRRKRWPIQNWAALCGQLAAEGHPLVVSCGPAPEETAFCRQLQAQLPRQLILTEGKLSWAQTAGLFYAAKLFIGVDTAAMHLAAACQRPIVALFGPSAEHTWRPWGAPHRLVLPPTAVPVAELQQRRTADIPVSEVLQAARELLE